MNEQNKEKLIAHLEKGTEIFLLLNDDTGIIGVVERNVLCWEETDGNWHEQRKNIIRLSVEMYLKFIMFHMDYLMWIFLKRY